MEAPVLKPPYRDFATNGQWDQYREALCRDGILWGLNLDFPTLAAHLMPLCRMPDKGALPDRLAMLAHSCLPDAPIAPMEDFYGRFIAQKDADAAVCTALAAVFMIFDRGRFYGRFETWGKRMDALLADETPLSPMALAAATGIGAFVEGMTRGRHDRAAPILRKAVSLAKAADAGGLWLHFSTHLGYCYLIAGDFALLDPLLDDIAVICGRPDAPFFLIAQYNGLRGMTACYQGDTAAAKAILREITEHPHFKDLPNSAWLYILCHLVFCAAMDDDHAMIDELLPRLQHRVIPAGNYYNHVYLHMNLGLIHFAKGDPHKAMRHLTESMGRDGLIQSKAGKDHLLLLMGQIMTELGNDKEAIAFFNANIPRWSKHYILMASTAGHFELARMYYRSGNIDKARFHFKQGVQESPTRSDEVIMHRPQTFLKDLKQALFPEQGADFEVFRANDHRIRIATFGDLRLRIDDRAVYDRQWKGGRTRLLLKALVVFGPVNVPVDVLTGTLWPHTEDDKALNRLRVTLSRLRKVVQNTKGPKVDWIVVKDGRVSLKDSLCDIDTIRFKTGLSAARRDGDMSLLQEALVSCHICSVA